MANKPFDYTIINPYERPKSADLNQMQGQAHADVRLLARQLFLTPTYFTDDDPEGFVGPSFRVTRYSGNFGFKFLQGVGFQAGPVNTSIGNITGVNDEYTYKPLTIQSREVIFPSGYASASGKHRYDLIEVRALSGAPGSTEQLTGLINTDILDPNTKSFSELQKYKTLTFDLTSTDIQYINAGDTGTAPIVIKRGVEVISGDEPSAPLPDVGYLSVAVIHIDDSAAPLAFSDITDVRPVLSPAVDTRKIYGDALAVTKGGTGRSTLTENALLAGNEVGEVKLIAVPSAGNVLYSNGTTWQATNLNDTITRYYTKTTSTTNQYDVPWSGQIGANPSGSWVTLSALTLNTVVLRPGMARISVEPAQDLANAFFSAWCPQNDPVKTARIAVRLKVASMSFSVYYYYTYQFNLNADSSQYIPLNIYKDFSVPSSAQYTFTLEAQSAGTQDFNIQVYANYMTLVVAQG